MRELDGMRATASLHAAKRALKRVPVSKGAELSQASYWAEGMVLRALRDGRKAVRCPSWCVRDNEVGLRRRARASKGSGHLRFVWNEDETVAALVRRISDHHGTLWLVVTVLARNVERV